MTLPPKKRSRRRRLAHRGPMPYRYDRHRSPWVPLSLVANGILLSWLGSSLVQPNPHGQRLVQASPLGDSQEPATLSQQARAVRLTYDQWVAQLKLEVQAIALKNPSNISILAGDSLSLWFPEALLPQGQIWLNQGISGETSQGLMRRVGLWKSLQPQRIFVMIGINDLLKGDKAEVVLANYQSIVRDLRQTHPETAIVVQSVLPHSGPSATWEERAKLSRISNGEILGINRRLGRSPKPKEPTT